MSYVSRFIEAFYSTPTPRRPDITPDQSRRATRRRQQRYRDFVDRGQYCDEVIAILNDPTHNKTTE